MIRNGQILSPTASNEMLSPDSMSLMKALEDEKNLQEKSKQSQLNNASRRMI